jgi:transcriptional regulator with XRE-family HTH domain
MRLKKCLKNHLEILCNDSCHNSYPFGGISLKVIGENVRRLRKIHDLNQIEFAKLIGVSQGSLSDIESGKCNPSVETVVSIYSTFECSLEWLLNTESQKKTENTISNSELSYLEQELISTFRELDSENQIEAFEIVKLKKKRNIT